MTPLPPAELLGLPRSELREWVASACDASPYRGDQLFRWLHQRLVRDPLLMTDLAREFRERLTNTVSIPTPVVRRRDVSRDGTRKYLVEVGGGALVESVFIKQEQRNTLCISSQVGCAMGCTFCRTGTMGLIRHLSSHEIIAQVHAVSDDCRIQGDTFSNVVFMGMGEPLHNLENVVRAVRILRDDLGFGIAGRRITVSTSGLLPEIERFGQAGLDVNLAVSLNATTDEVRDQVMPVNKRYPIAALLETLRGFPLSSRRTITIEYVLLAGVNDTAEDLARLPKLLRGIRAKVNLIPYNSNADRGFSPPESHWVTHWHRTLLSKQVAATIRWSKGPDINAACGQLATTTTKVRRSERLVQIAA